jgi:hypothetical protein
MVEYTTNQKQDIEEKYTINGFTRSEYNTLPKVFTDGNTGVKITLVENYVNCTRYESRTGLTFKGCFEYSGRFRQLRGVHLVLDKPILIIDSRAKLVPGVFEMKSFQNLIIRAIRELENLINFRVYRELLITYDSWGFVIYDKWIRGRTIEFPVRAYQGHLYVSEVPKPPIELNYETVKTINVYNHTIEFQNEVEKAEITSFGGKAIIVRNISSNYIDFKMSSPDHMTENSWIPPKRYFMITHPRPKLD